MSTAGQLACAGSVSPHGRHFIRNRPRVSFYLLRLGSPWPAGSCRHPGTAVTRLTDNSLCPKMQTPPYLIVGTLKIIRGAQGMVKRLGWSHRTSSRFSSSSVPAPGRLVPLFPTPSGGVLLGRTENRRHKSTGGSHSSVPALGSLDRNEYRPNQKFLQVSQARHLLTLDSVHIGI